MQVRVWLTRQSLCVCVWCAGDSGWAGCACLHRWTEVPFGAQLPPVLPREQAEVGRVPPQCLGSAPRGLCQGRACVGLCSSWNGTGWTWEWAGGPLWVSLGRRGRREPYWQWDRPRRAGREWSCEATSLSPGSFFWCCLGVGSPLGMSGCEKPWVASIRSSGKALPAIGWPAA